MPSGPGNLFWGPDVVMSLAFKPSLGAYNVFRVPKAVLGPRSCELGSRQAVCGALNRVFGAPTMVLGLRCCDFGRLQAEVGALKRAFGFRKHVLGPTLGGSFRLKPRMR